jgi:hypothetical protein
MTDDDFTVTSREIRVAGGRRGPLVTVIGLDFENRTPTYVPRKTLGKYALLKLKPEIADIQRGEIPDVDGTPVTCIGTNFAKYYYRSHDNRTVPTDVRDWMDENNLVLIKNVDGGWQSWGGRPEFSTSYIDYRDATIVSRDDDD